MNDRLAVIVPTRGRPENIRKVLAAWDFTNAWTDADLFLAVDADDPMSPGYWQVVTESPHSIVMHEVPTWRPMVPKLNEAAMSIVDRGYSAIAFAGDDHLPRTIGWARRYLDALAELGSGMVYGDDGFQGANLATEWAVTADAIRALGKMVPAPVDHLYCDNAMMDLFGGAGAMRHLPEIRIEHMHPVAGKAARDAQYDRVNGREQYRGDRAKYLIWKNLKAVNGLSDQLETIRALRPGRPVVTAKQKRQRRETVRLGSGPRKVERSGPSTGGRNAPPKSKFPFPRQFREVIGATPDEIAFTLADFAKNVPADQEIVELGVYQARTALIMAWGASQGNGAHVTAIDAWDLPGNTYDPPFTDEATRRQAFYNVESLGYADKITLINSFATEVAARFPDHMIWIRKPVGLLFVDDDHSYEGAKAAIETWAPHLAGGAVIAVDDYEHPDWPGVAQAVDELVDNGFLAPIELYHEHLAVTRLTGQISTMSQFKAQYPDSRPPVATTPITAITSEGVELAPTSAPGLDLEDLPLSDLRALGKKHGVSHAGVMGAPKLIEALRGKGL